MIPNKHLLVFGHEGNICLTKQEIKKFLVELSDLVGLNVLCPPVVAEGTVKPGLTGVVVIEESHIAIHTFTDHPSEFWLDILSCKPFCDKKVIKFIQDKFKFKRIEVKHK